MKNKKNMSRSRFLGFLGKIGILSLIPGIHAHAAGVRAVILEKTEDKTELREIAKPTARRKLEDSRHNSRRSRIRRFLCESSAENPPARRPRQLHSALR